MKPFIYLLMLIGLILQCLFIYVENKENYPVASVLKGSASLMFVLVGYNAYLLVNNPFNKTILLGLIFGMLGDILLSLRFVFTKQGQKIFLFGILVFLIGHIFYLAVLIKQAQHIWIYHCTLIGLLLAAGLLFYIFKTMDIKKAFKIFGVVYLSVIFVMCSIAIGVAMFIPSNRSIVFALGAVLFTASDIILIFNTFSGSNKLSLRIANLLLYYVGQLLIAYSMFL